MRRINVVGVVAALVAVACGPTNKNKDGIADGIRTPTDVTLTAPSTPTGTISGQVLDSTLAPMAGVTVSLNGSYLAATDGGTLTTTTDSSGNWTVGGVPAGGPIEVVVGKSNFATVHASAAINNTSGNVPESNANAMVGPLVLTQLNATLKFMVINQLGKPAQGAKATLEAGPVYADFSQGSGAGYGAPNGVVVASATSDANGVLTFTGIPGPDELARISGSLNNITNYVLTIAALDINGDGIPDAAGSVTQYSAQQLVTDNTTPVVTLSPARTQNSLSLLSSNVQSFFGNNSPLLNMLKSTDPIYMVFNQYLLNSAINVRVVDETGKTVVGVAPPTVTGGSVLTITPSAALQAGKEYNIAVHVVSLDDGEERDYIGYFFGGDPAGTPATPDIASIQFHDLGGPGNGALDPGEVVDILFNQPVSLFGVTSNLQLAIIFFNANLGGTATIGDYPGETGYNTGGSLGGFWMIRNEYWNETGTVFQLAQSGYTTRYSFAYSNVFLPGNSGTTLPQIPVNTNVTLDFTHITVAGRGLQTTWGQQYLTPITKPLTLAP